MAFQQSGLPQHLRAAYMRDPRLQMANALQNQATTYQPMQHWMQGAAKIVQALKGRHEREEVQNEFADKAQSYHADLARALSAKDPTAALSGSSDPYLQRVGMENTLAQKRRQQDRAAKFDDAVKLFGIKTAMTPTEQPTSVQEYEYAKKGGYGGSYADWLAESGDKGQEKFGNSPIWGQDANGNPVLMQPSNRGGVKMVEMPEGVTPMRGQTSKVDLGDRYAVLDANGTAIGYMPKGIGPERKLTDGRVVTMPGVSGAALQGGGKPSVSIDLANGGASGPAPRLGGGLTAMGPGGGIQAVSLPPSPEEVRQKKDKEAQKQRSADVVMQDIKRALKMADDDPAFTTGLGGAVLSNVPGTEAHDLENTLNTIKGNVGFDRLQQMRDASPTGGALGQVSENENKLLQSVLGSLEQSQSPEQFRFNLKRLHNTYNDIVHGEGNGPERFDIGGKNPSPDSTTNAGRGGGSVDGDDLTPEEKALLDALQ